MKHLNLAVAARAQIGLRRETETLSAEENRPDSRGRRLSLSVQT